MRRHPLRVMPVLSTKDLAARLDIYTGTLGWTRGLGIPGLDGNEVFAIDSMNNGVVFGLSALPSPEPKRTGVVLMCYVDDAVDNDESSAARSSNGAVFLDVRDENWRDRCFDLSDPVGCVSSVTKTVTNVPLEDIAAAAASSDP